MFRNTPKVAEVEIFGGIGNQLFQFAAGRYLETRHGIICRYSGWRTGYKVKLPFLQQNMNEKFLHAFSLTAERILSKVGVLRRIEILCRNVYVSYPIGWDPELAKKVPGKRLRGYFQSHIYASSLDAVDKSLILELKHASSWYKSKLAQIQELDVVAVHIRRGDYKNNPDIGTLDMEYYLKALAQIDEKMQFKNVWIFSDDNNVGDELRRKIGASAQLVIQDANASDFESMILMSKAKKIIIANSTFSWWAAFLAISGTKVVAPSKWFKSLDDPIDLIPKHWTRVESTWES
jgi:hypothetical protein